MAKTKTKTKSGLIAAPNGNRIGPVEIETPTIIIPRPRIATIDVAIRSLSPLIVHAWSVKAKKQMLDRQMKKATGPKQAKDPEAEYRSSMYLADEGWFGVPSSAFKAAMVGAGRQVDGLPMTLLKRSIFVEPEGRSSTQNVDLTQIHGTPTMREDMVRLESGVADIRYRAQFLDWSATLRITFNAGLLSEEQVVNLCDLAGLFEGICEWRPSAPKSATGIYGRWTVVR